MQFFPGIKFCEQCMQYFIKVIFAKKKKKSKIKGANFLFEIPRTYPSFACLPGNCLIALLLRLNGLANYCQ